MKKPDKHCISQMIKVNKICDKSSWQQKWTFNMFRMEIDIHPCGLPVKKP